MFGIIFLDKVEIIFLDKFDIIFLEQTPTDLFRRFTTQCIVYEADDVISNDILHTSNI